MPRLSKPTTITTLPTPIIVLNSLSSSASRPTSTAPPKTASTLNHPPLTTSPTPPTQPTTHQHAPPTPPQEASTFLCTICWQTQSPPSKPQLLGTSSRIVCRACWKAVLDLSICWVCGECIVRGDEVVSLGWCFWHRACFGCLVCGVGLEVGDFEERREVGRWGDFEGEGSCGRNGRDGGVRGKRKRMIGVELETVPLCTRCEVETASAPYAEVVERGSEMVSRFDGGLSRDCLDILSEEKPQTRRASRSRWKRSRFRGSSGLERELKRYINGSTSQWSEFAMADDDEAQAALIKHAADMGVSEDGNIDGEHVHSDDEITLSDFINEYSPPDVCIPVIDPVGEPASRPRKTKSLPKWMSLLPSNVHRERYRRQKSSTFESYPHTHEMERMDGRSSPAHDCCPTENDNEDTSTPSSETTPKALSRSSTVPTSVSIDIPGIFQAPRQPRITISANPERQRAFGDVDHRESVYITPPEYASGFFLARQRTPYPTRYCLSVTRSETTSPFADGAPRDIPVFDEISSYPLLADSLESSLPPLPDEGPSHASHAILPSDSSSRIMIQSSEYLERYQPKSAETKHRRYVAKEREPVMEKIRRQRVGKHRRLGEVTEETSERRSNTGSGNKRMKFGNEERELDPRREALKNELKNLLGEE